MYRVLLVDDEKIARESVYSLLATQNDLELELLTADSAVRAVSILETERIDITVMDINMPQMTGLELYDVVREKWPQCKVVFLTGYSEFDYVYKVHKHARYVLKADREEILLDAIRESIREIENEMIVAHASDIDPGFKKRAGFYRSSDFINELLEGYTGTDVVSNDILQDMNITLDIHQKMYPILLCCEDVSRFSFQRRQQIMEKFSMLMDRYFLSDTKYAVAYYKKRYVFLILQLGNPMSEEKTIRRLMGYCSLFQNALQLNASVSAAILLSDHAMYFNNAIDCFGLLYDGIAGVKIGDTQLFSSCQQKETIGARGALSEQNRQFIFQASLKLDFYFESANREAVLSTIREIRSAAHQVSSMHDLFLLEVYCSISAQLLKIIKQYEISEQIAFQIGIIDLYNLSAHRNWEQAFVYLEEVARKAFDLHEKKWIEEQQDLVSRIRFYIQDHLDGDTSLTAIAEHFHFSREYLLRVFKKESGITILQYINDIKINKAKELLKNPELPIKEIAQLLGFNSTGYFIRFFKSKMGISPKVYREHGTDDKAFSVEVKE